MTSHTLYLCLCCRKDISWPRLFSTRRSLPSLIGGDLDLGLAHKVHGPDWSLASVFLASHWLSGLPPILSAGSSLPGDAAADMEGSMMKWTNYLSGWQQRYFVLDRGILSYYDSQDDVGKGSKGSIKMAVCEIRVHQADSCRMDLFIPREQSFYLRAESAAERQRWLVALGSAKACLGDVTTQQTKELFSDGESLNRKLSELRLFCDLLMEQVMEIQGAVAVDNPAAAPDKEKLSAACSVLHGTCSHVCSTLDKCMKYANNLHPLIQGSSLPALPEDVVGNKLPQSRKVKRSFSQPAVPTLQRTSESPRRSDGVTITKNLEEMAIRVHSRKQHFLPSSNGITE